MEIDRFDRLARIVGGAASRRQIIRAVLGGAVAGVVHLGRADTTLAQDKGCCRCLNRLRTKTTCTNEIGQRECKIQCEATGDDEVFFSRRHVCSRGAEGNLACRFKQPTVEVADAGCATDTECPEATFCAVAACVAAEEETAVAAGAVRAMQDEPVATECIETAVCCSEGDRCGADGTLCCADGTYCDGNSECVPVPEPTIIYDPVAISAGLGGLLSGFGAIAHSFITDPVALIQRRILPEGDPPSGFAGVFASSWALEDDDAPGELEFSEAGYLNTYYFNGAEAARDFYAAEVDRSAALGAYSDVTGDARIGNRSTIWTGGFPYGDNAYLNRDLTQWTRDNVVEVFTHDAFTAEAEPAETEAVVKFGQSIDRLLRGAKTSSSATNRIPVVGSPTETNVTIRRWPTAEQLGYKQADDSVQRDALFAGDATSLVQINYQTMIGGQPLVGFGSQLGFIDEQAARAWLNNSPTAFVQLDQANDILERQYLDSLPPDFFGGREFSANAFLWNVPTGLVSGMESRVVVGSIVSTFAFVNPTPLPEATRLQDLLGGAEDSEDMQLIGMYLRNGYSNDRIYYELFGGDISDHPEFLAALIAHRVAYYTDIPVEETASNEDESEPSFVGEWIEEAVTMS